MTLKQRFNKIIAIIAARGTGKTTIVKGDKVLNIKGLFDIYLARKIKIVVVLTDDHPSYREYPIIKKNEFQNFKEGIGRIFINPEDINSFCRWFNDHPNKWNTLTVFEDARNHSQKSICLELNRMMQNSKQDNNDIIFMYHSFGETPKDIFRKIDYIELGKTMDHPAIRKEDMSAYYDKVVSAYESLKTSANRFLHKTISTIDEIK